MRHPIEQRAYTWYDRPRAFIERPLHPVAQLSQRHSGAIPYPWYGQVHAAGEFVNALTSSDGIVDLPTVASGEAGTRPYFPRRHIQLGCNLMRRLPIGEGFSDLSTRRC